MTINRINPENMHQNPAFTQVVTVDAPAKLVFVGGQNGVDKSGKVVSKDIAAQSEQAMRNLTTALEAAGATMADVFKMSVYIVQGNSLEAAFAGALKVQKMQPPPTVTMLFVAALGNPNFLIEIEAVAAVKGKGS